MARIRFDGLDRVEKQFGKLGRPMIRSLVEAGGRAAVERMRENIETRRHVRTGDMLAGTVMSDYIETLNGGSVEVYPQGDDSKGQRNATKAFVINYGVPGNRHTRSGDRFITGDTARAEKIVHEAMKQESDRLLREIGKK